MTKVQTFLFTTALLLLSTSFGWADSQERKPKPTVLTPESLPKGLGRDIISSACTQCHEIGEILAEPHSAQEWIEVLDRMAALGTELDSNQYFELLGYLVDNFTTPLILQE